MVTLGDLNLYIMLNSSHLTSILHQLAVTNEMVAGVRQGIEHALPVTNVEGASILSHLLLRVSNLYEQQQALIVSFLQAKDENELMSRRRQLSNVGRQRRASTGTIQVPGAIGTNNLDPNKDGVMSKSDANMKLAVLAPGSSSLGPDSGVLDGAVTATNSGASTNSSMTDLMESWELLELSADERKNHLSLDTVD